MNLSSKPLTQPQTSVLAKGLNFALPPKQIPTAEIVTCTETALRRAGAPQEITDRARTQVVGILSKAKSPSTNLSPAESKALKELRNETSLIIIPADKGRATVVMDRETYDTKVTSMLSDPCLLYTSPSPRDS